MTQPDPRSREKPPSATEQRLSKGLAVLAVLGALVSLLATTSWARQRRELLALVSEAGVSDAPLIRRLEREATPHHAQLVAARALIYSTLTLQQSEDEERRQALVDKLPEAEVLARNVLASQPNSWQAAMLLGTATYLQWSIARDDRLYTEAARWEQPLTKAVRDAEGHPEPRRILATAYLEVWHALSADKKETAKALIGKVFDDDLRAFEALSPIWFELSLDLEQSLDVVPDVPDAWAKVERSFSRTRRWPEFIIAYEKRLDALEKKLEAQRDEGELRLRLGDFVDSRSILLRVVHQSPASRRFLPLVTSALKLYPPGLHGLASTQLLEPWVDWSLELSRLGLEGLPPEAMGLLLDAIVNEDFPPSKAALMALRAEDRYQAERFEKLAQPLTLYVWAPYLIAKAGELAAEGRGQQAREALAQVALAARNDLPFLQASRKAAAAIGDLPAEEDFRQKIEELRKIRWRGSEWRARNNRPTLDLLASNQAAGLEIEIRKAPAQGAVVEIRWDGTAIAHRKVREGQRLQLDLSIDTTPHFLEFRAIAGGSVTPGEVALR